MLGIFLIIMGMLLLIAESLLSDRMKYPAEEGEMEGRSVRGGAVVMIGPLPIVIGSDQRVAGSLMILALALMLTWLVFTYLIYAGHV